MARSLARPPADLSGGSFHDDSVGTITLPDQLLKELLRTQVLYSGKEVPSPREKAEREAKLEKLCKDLNFKIPFPKESFHGKNWFSAFLMLTLGGTLHEYNERRTVHQKLKNNESLRELVWRVIGNNSSRVHRARILIDQCTKLPPDQINAAVVEAFEQFDRKQSRKFTRAPGSYDDEYARTSPGLTAFLEQTTKELDSRCIDQGLRDSLREELVRNYAAEVKETYQRNLRLIRDLAKRDKQAGLDAISSHELKNACEFFGLPIPKKGCPVDLDPAKKAHKGNIRVHHPDLNHPNRDPKKLQQSIELINFLESYNRLAT